MASPLWTRARVCTCVEPTPATTAGAAGAAGAARRRVEAPGHADRCAVRAHTHARGGCTRTLAPRRGPRAEKAPDTHKRGARACAGGGVAREGAPQCAPRVRPLRLPGPAIAPLFAARPLHVLARPACACVCVRACVRGRGRGRGRRPLATHDRAADAHDCTRARACSARDLMVGRLRPSCRRDDAHPAIPACLPDFLEIECWPIT
jgi:hypothetical protein